MVNASFVFGMDHDDRDVFDRTVDWAVRQGIETATFHILTPYPGTALGRRLAVEGRVLHSDWDLYDTRHAVFEPARMTPAQLEGGYLRAYRQFYRWRSIVQAAMVEQGARDRTRHLLYTAGWKKLEPLWDVAIRHGKVQRLLPLLETILADFGDTAHRVDESALDRRQKSGNSTSSVRRADRPRGAPGRAVRTALEHVLAQVTPSSGW